MVMTMLSIWFRVLTVGNEKVGHIGDVVTFLDSRSHLTKIDENLGCIKNAICVISQLATLYKICF